MDGEMSFNEMGDRLRTASFIYMRHRYECSDDIPLRGKVKAKLILSQIASIIRAAIDRNWNFMFTSFWWFSISSEMKCFSLEKKKNNKAHKHHKK